MFCWLLTFLQSIRIWLVCKLPHAVRSWVQDRISEFDYPTNAQLNEIDNYSAQYYERHLRFCLCNKPKTQTTRAKSFEFSDSVVKSVAFDLYCRSAAQWNG